MDMREEFELHYAEEFAAVRGYKPTPDEMVSMRDGDGYGADRGYLNGYWKGWQASRDKLVVELPKTPNNGMGFSLFDHVKEMCKEAIESQGIPTK